MKRTHLIITVLVALLNYTEAFSQQTIRGTIRDKITENTIPYAKIKLTTNASEKNVLADIDGDFTIPKVVLGRQSLTITSSGYEPYTIADLNVTAGKEIVLDIRMVEDISEQEEVIVTANNNEPKNEMSVVSTTSFSVEETQKYAASFNDPARMATSFAGVVGGNGINNDISVRGNSPRGILWRLEGIEIPNPNHFSSVGTSGGGLSIISAQLMGDSDFSTGAFAAEYGNALSGVFDLSLRKGNNQKREYTLQAGVLGVDISTEGPFKKGYKGSYLINYRYSSLSIVQKIMKLDEDQTNFQDLSFNIYLPTKSLGNFSVFGLGGLSDEIQETQQDSSIWKTEPWRRYSGVFKSNTGVIGATHKLRIGEAGILKSSLAISSTLNGDYTDYIEDDYQLRRLYTEDFGKKKLTLSSNYKQKLSANSNVKVGLIFSQTQFSLLQADDELDNGILVTSINEKGRLATGQAFIQHAYRFNQKFTLNTGLHYLHLFKNNTYNIEPRVSMSYQFKKNQSISAAFGMHSQTQPIGSYFALSEDQNGVQSRPNINLELNKAIHYVIGYSIAIKENHNLKFELYFQDLYNIPINSDNDSTYSLINDDEGFEVNPLEQGGKGRNYGIDITLNRTLSNNLYYLVSASIYDSKYQALNKEWYNTRFNTNYVLNITAGKQWVLKNTKKRRTLGVNIKSVLTGGYRTTPVIVDEENGETIVYRDYTKTFENALSTFFRSDIQFSLQRDYKNVTSTLSLDLRNVTNRKNVAGQFFNETNLTVEDYHHVGFIPVLSYKINF